LDHRLKTLYCLWHVPLTKILLMVFM
jgi:hypothetical protein